jgi:hypothetical protein
MPTSSSKPRSVGLHRLKWLLLMIVLPPQHAGSVCNDRFDIDRLICRYILFSAEYRLYLGKNRGGPSSW